MEPKQYYYVVPLSYTVDWDHKNKKSDQTQHYTIPAGPISMFSIYEQSLNGDKTLYHHMSSHLFSSELRYWALLGGHFDPDLKSYGDLGKGYKSAFCEDYPYYDFSAAEINYMADPGLHSLRYFNFVIQAGLNAIVNAGIDLIKFGHNGKAASLKFKYRNLENNKRLIGPQFENENYMLISCGSHECLTKPDDKRFQFDIKFMQYPESTLSGFKERMAVQYDIKFFIEKI